MADPGHLQPQDTGEDDLPAAPVGSTPTTPQHDSEGGEMSGHPTPSPEEEARLRRLLADARHEAPVPADVATRLDEVLGRLEAGEDVPSGVSGTGVLELAAARRRRAASMLVAAAAVIAVGIGLGQVVDLSGGSSGDSSSAGESLATADEDAGIDERSTAPDRGETGDDPQLDGGAESGPAGGSTLTREQPSRGVVVVDRRLARVGDDSFGDDAAVVQRRAIRVGGGPSARVARLRAAPRPVARRWQDCAPAEWGEGLPVAVLYDGEPAVLAFREPAGDSQVVDLLQCGTGGVLRSTTLPRR